MRIILVGQAPERSAVSELLVRRMDSRLASLAGLSLEEYLRTFERVNVLQSWPGKTRKGDAFPMAAARLSAMLLRPSLAGAEVVFLGKKVVQAFCHGDADWFRWSVGHARGVLYAWAAFPHPSGVSHWWNDAANVLVAENFMRSLVTPGRKTRRWAS